MRLNYRRTILVGLAFFSICAFWQMYDNVVPLMLKNTFHMRDDLAGVIMAMDNVLALFMLPLFGMLSDRSRTPVGKRMPYILGGTAVAVVLMNLLPLADQRNQLTMFVVVLGLLLVAMGVYRSPAVALMPDVTPKPLRSKGNAIINLMGALGGVFTLGVTGFAVTRDGLGRENYTLLFVAVSLLMAVSVVVLLLTIRENKLAKETAALEAEGEQRGESPTQNKRGEAPEAPEALEAAATLKERGEAPEALEAAATQNKRGEAPAPDFSLQLRKSKGFGALSPELRQSLILILVSVSLWFMGYNAVTTAFTKYVSVQWGYDIKAASQCLMVATVGAVLSYLPVGMLSTRFGRKRMIQSGVLLLSACFATGALFQTFHPVVYVVFALIGAAWAMINVNSYPMVVEISKQADVGQFTGYYYTFSMAAQIVTPIVSGLLLQHVGYWTLMPYAALMVLLSFVTITLTRHGDSKPQKPTSKLEAFAGDD